jgi:hypothetical protein
MLNTRDEPVVAVPPPLSQAVGYIVVVVIGLVIAFGKILHTGEVPPLTVPSDGSRHPSTQEDCW